MKAAQPEPGVRLFTFPSEPVQRHKTVIEKIQANIVNFSYFAVIDPGERWTVCDLYVSDGRVWWDAKDPTSRITATVASPFKVYAKSAGPLIHGSFSRIPTQLAYLSELEVFLKSVFSPPLLLTKKDASNV